MDEETADSMIATVAGLGALVSFLLGVTHAADPQAVEDRRDATERLRDLILSGQASGYDATGLRSVEFQLALLNGAIEGA